MKRYERMSREELMETFKGTDWCHTCVLSDSKNECTVMGKSCCEAMCDYLNKEIKVVSRWQIIKSDEDCMQMLQNWNKESNTEIGEYLLEKIEVEETE